MLAKVIRPDGTEIVFKYDPLGRRIEKKMPETTKYFIWDGNNPLHEWEDGNSLRDLVTWVFNDGFVPTAKLTNGGNYSIVSDYLGTPVEAYDAEGVRVWSAELDIFGRVKEFAGEVDFVPFRYQGQYADIETGLYYNRFRYYDPDTGQYTQQDPIGLAGNNPTLYGYVHDPNAWIDPFGLIILFRGERSSVTPDNVFKNGFSPVGTHNNLLDHVSSNSTRGNFVSTSESFKVASSFAGKNGYIYVIDTERGINVNNVLKNSSPFPEQLEHSIPGKVKPNEIVGVYPKKGGLVTGDFIPNNSNRAKY